LRGSVPVELPEHSSSSPVKVRVGLLQTSRLVRGCHIVLTLISIVFPSRFANNELLKRDIRLAVDLPHRGMWVSASGRLRDDMFARGVHVILVVILNVKPVDGGISILGYGPVGSVWISGCVSREPRRDRSVSKEVGIIRKVRAKG
jgi:hypothetical protein